MTRHKVFISYHHSNDQCYKEKFSHLFGDRGANIIIDGSVDTRDIDDTNLKTETIRQIIRDDYIADSTVIIVLIGAETWKRKFVDWEISSGIRATKNNSRCALIGVFLPSHPNYGSDKFTRSIIPPRLSDNCGGSNESYAILCDWTENPHEMYNYIERAFDNRTLINPVNKRPMFSKNRSGNKWTD